MTFIIPSTVAKEATIRRQAMSSANTTRTRLESQGYAALEDQTLAGIQFGLRFSPAFCALGVAIGTLLASPPILLVVLATAFIGAATPRHPFDLVYNHGVRHLLGKPAIPRNGAPRRFSCAVGAAWLAVTTAAFLAGWSILGYALGAGMVAMASFVALTHICLPSLVYLRLFGRVSAVPELSVDEAANRLRDGATMVDVRSPEYFHAGHAPGAVRMELSELSSAAAKFDADQPVLVVCQGGAESLRAAKILLDAGVGSACSVSGGMAAWLKHGLPLEHGEGSRA